jgi:hypothetical protein
MISQTNETLQRASQLLTGYESPIEGIFSLIDAPILFINPYNADILWVRFNDGCRSVAEVYEHLQDRLDQLLSLALTTDNDAYETELI